MMPSAKKPAFGLAAPSTQPLEKTIWPKPRKMKRRGFEDAVRAAEAVRIRADSIATRSAGYYETALSGPLRPRLPLRRIFYGSKKGRRIDPLMRIMTLIAF